MEQQSAILEWVDPKDLKPNKFSIDIYGEDGYSDLLPSVKELGVLQPLFVSTNNVIISGHRRWKAALIANVQVPVIRKRYASKLDEHQAIIELNRYRVKTGHQLYNEGNALKGIEAIKAKQRQIQGGKEKVVQDLAQPKTRDTIAEAIGLGSGFQWDKLEFVAEHKPDLLVDIKPQGISINRAYNLAKREVKKAEAKEVRTIDVLDIKPIIKLGDFRELMKELADNSIDLILTDPPYGKEYLDLWQSLAKEASRVLKPSAFLITYSGQTHLPQVLNTLCQYLSYYWLGMLYHKGATLQVHHRNMWNRAKPILFFQKPPFNKQVNWLEDVIISEAPDKELHDWGQNIEPLIYLLKHFTQEGDIVLDPFMGGGASIEACLQLKRSIIAFDNDKQSYDLVMQRLNNDKA